MDSPAAVLHGHRSTADVDTSGAGDTVLEEFVKKITKSYISRCLGNFTTNDEVMCDQLIGSDPLYDDSCSHDVRSGGHPAAKKVAD